MNVLTDDDTLVFPCDITERIGMSKNEINALKSKGCPFFGKKTTVNIVRSFVFRTMGAESLLGKREHRSRSAVSKFGE